MKLVWLFLILFVYNWSTIFSTNLERNELSFYVCDIIKDLLANETATQDIVIGNLGGKVSSSTVNEIAECAAKNGNSVVMTDFNVPITERNLRKAVMMIVELETLNLDEIGILFTRSTAWNHNVKLICLTSSQMNISSLNDLVGILKDQGMMNFAVLHQADDNITTYWRKSATGLISKSTSKPNAKEIFDDKLKNLDGYNYRIPICQQIPRVTIKNGIVYTPMDKFLKAVTKIQNAGIHYMIIENCHDVHPYWRSREMDLTFNTIYSTGYIGEQKLLTYEEQGYCALVPLPGKTSMFLIIFNRPFDILTWLCIFLTVVGCFVVWWLFRGRGAVDSPWLVVYGFFVMFIGQGVKFSRRNRLVLTILLQLIIFNIFLLRNFYEGAITSFMIQPFQENKLHTFDDILESKLEIVIDGKFESMIQTFKEYRMLKPRLVVINSSFTREWMQKELMRHHYVFFLRCQSIVPTLHRTMRNGQKLTELYYLMQTSIMSDFVELEASYRNPFIERLQYYMDLAFQAGLTQFWQDPAKRHDNDMTSVTYLKLEDLSQVFGILFIGHTLALLVFLCEIFFHDFLRNLRFGYLAKKLSNRVYPLAHKKRMKNSRYERGALFYIIHRHQKKKRLNVKKISMRSREEVV